MKPYISQINNHLILVEGKEQFWLQKTDDHKEGVKAVAERRVGNFNGKR